MHTNIIFWFSKKRSYLQFIPTLANVLPLSYCPAIHAGFYKIIPLLQTGFFFLTVQHIFMLIRKWEELTTSNMEDAKFKVEIY